jgi:hypothetical protein
MLILFSKFLSNSPAPSGSVESRIVSRIQSWLENATFETIGDHIASELPPALLFSEQVQHRYIAGREFYKAFCKFFIQKTSFNFGRNQSSARLSHGTSANNVMLHVAREF